MPKIRYNILINCVKLVIIFIYYILIVFKYITFLEFFFHLFVFKNIQIYFGYQFPEFIHTLQIRLFQQCKLVKGKDITFSYYFRYPLYVSGTRQNRFIIPDDSKKKEIIRYRVRLPPYLTCSQCVLQWTYYTGQYGNILC